MRGFVVLLLLAGSAQAQGPELLDRILGKLAEGKPVVREALVRPPHSVAALQRAMGSIHTGDVAERACAAGVPVVFSISREGSSETETALIASPPTAKRADWKDLQHAKRRIREAYLRWSAQTPQATFRVAVRLVGVTP